MSAIIARTGRDHQRYEDNLRLVSGCIPYRLVKEEEDQYMGLEKRVEVLMVSSPNRDDMVFPKGGWENDETVEEAACREALEEAGVQGILKETPLGVWEFRSKSNQEVCSQEGGCKGYMFALEVTDELDDWPEQKNRDRKWVSMREAFEVCRYEWMRSALEKFMQVMFAKNTTTTTTEYKNMEEEAEVEEEEVLIQPAHKENENDYSESEAIEVVVKDDDDDDDDDQVMSNTNCHIKKASNFGINVLPPGISL